MADLEVDDAVTVTVNEDGTISMSMKQALEENGLEDGVNDIVDDEGPKQLQLQIVNEENGLNGNHVVQEGDQLVLGETEMITESSTIIPQDEDDDEDSSTLIRDEESNDALVQDSQEVVMTEGNVVLQEEIVQPAIPTPQYQNLPPQYQNLIIQHMDIAEPLSTLKQLLELRLQCSLADHQFYLQDSIPLDTRKSLVDQCVQGEGMVQINLEVKSQPGLKPKINILDILKPAEEVEQYEQAAAPPTPGQAKVVMPVAEETENITRWIVDQHFRREQDRLRIPYDPVQWSEIHVKHWIQWAVREFCLDNVDINNFNMTGQDLCDMTHSDFIKYIPNDRGDIFWTHLELLRKCKFVAVMQQPPPQAVTTITVSTSGKKTWKQNRNRAPRITGDHGFSPGNRTGNNGQIQLWQFLLELLTDKDCREVIQWVGDEGEFKLNNPEMVAQLWGQRKNKPTMNYEKLSRALRYYYDGDMIAKVHGKRFVYKFVCDLKMLLGYSAADLNRQVTMCAEKKLQRVREALRPMVNKHKVTTQTVQTTLE